MHELSIARNIVAIVCDSAGSRPVKRVTLEVGARAGVLADAIAFCFPIVADGTVCAGARLEIRATGGGELNVKEMEVEAA